MGDTRGYSTIVYIFVYIGGRVTLIHANLKAHILRSYPGELKIAEPYPQIIHIVMHIVLQKQL
jgi:hypothetical protein